MKFNLHFFTFVLFVAFAAGTNLTVTVREQLHTLGDHLRRRRLTLRLPQEQAAKQLGVGRASLQHWEQDRQKPGAASLPAIVKFLGYNPLLFHKAAERRP
jgi:DNA-binding transcriptional regulator YiaG